MSSSLFCLSVSFNLYHSAACDEIFPADICFFSASKQDIQLTCVELAKYLVEAN